MKKLVQVVSIFVLLIALTACANSATSVMTIINQVAYHPQMPVEQRHLRVGVVAGPYGSMFMEGIYPALSAQGYTVELVMFDDFIQPNQSLANGSTDLNIFQHNNFLNNFKFEHGVELSAIAEVPTVSMGVFSHVYNSLEDISTGAVVAIPADDTNLTRALRVLQAAGLIGFNPQADITRVTASDIDRNPRGLVFVPVEASQLVSELNNHDMAVITGGFAFAEGLDIAGALYNEVLSDGLLIVVTVRTEDLARDFVGDILDVIHSDRFKSVIVDQASPYSGFQRPRYFFQ